MRSVGIRELKEHTSEILREVQQGEVINVTNQGATVARLIPVQRSPLGDEEIEMILDDLHTLAAEISAHWPASISVEDAMDDVRS